MVHWFRLQQDCLLISGWISVVLISTLEVALAVLVTHYLASNPSTYASHHNHCSWPTCLVANFGGLSCVDIDTYVGREVAAFYRAPQTPMHSVLPVKVLGMLLVIPKVQYCWISKLP